MTKSRLPLERRIFIPRSLPEAIILGDGQAIAGPFCVNCGNPQSIHRDTDLACPVRRLHPQFPSGEREECSCHPVHAMHHPDCDLIRYGFNGTVTR